MGSSSAYASSSYSSSSKYQNHLTECFHQVNDNEEVHPRGPKGSWLCGPGNYQLTVEEACLHDPGLLKPDRKNRRKTLGEAQSRMAVLEYVKGRRPECTDLPGPEQLRAYFLGQPDAGGAESRTTKRVYLLEGLKPGFVDLLGTQFNLDPSMFKKQERTCVFSSEHDWANDNVPLPTSRASSYLQLHYFVVLNFGMPLPSFQVSCADTGRHIGANKMLDEFQSNAAIRRKTSFWSKKYEGGGWDAVVLCDPPVRTLISGNQKDRPKTIDLAHKDLDHPNGATPFQGGFVDFVPHEEREYTKRGPPRTCMMEDFIYYFKTYADKLDTTSPECASLLVKKLVAAHLHEFFNYMRGLVYHHSWMTQPRRPGFTEEDLKISEDHWGIAQGLSLRTTQYVEDMWHNLVELGMDLDSSATDRTSAETPDWLEYKTDYRYVYVRLKELQARADLLGQTLNGLASMAAYRLAQESTSRAQGLTFVGLLFIPLAYVSGLFSMSEDYRPGQHLFKVYFATALPLMAIVLFVAYVFNKSFRRDAVKVLPKRIKDWVRSVRHTLEDNWATLRGAQTIPPDRSAARPPTTIPVKRPAV